MASGGSEIDVVTQVMDQRGMGGFPQRKFARGGRRGGRGGIGWPCEFCSNRCQNDREDSLNGPGQRGFLRESLSAALIFVTT